MTERFIVAEVSKNWRGAEPYVPGSKLLSHQFEDIINHNYERGYRLHSFTLHRLMTGPDLNESIIAVFEWRSDPGVPTERHGA